MKISAILITREKEYPRIVMERLALGFFDEIIVETECRYVYRRYELAKQAKNTIIYHQDDDCLVNFQVLFKMYNGRITNTMTLPFQKQYEPLGCTLMGWGSYYPSYMLNIFDKYIAKYGADDPHLLREADRIVTAMNKPFNTIIMPHEDVNQTPDRMCNEPEHFPSAHEALRKCSLL